MIQPTTLPLFPLTGGLLLPGGLLPLHIFEERYCSLIEDILEGHRTLGMVQPQAPNFADLRGEADEPENPRLYGIGCAGVLDQVQVLPQGRYLIVLKGLLRFRIRDELDLYRGYRQASVDYREFQIDGIDQDAEIDSQRLLEALKSFGESQGLAINLAKLGEISGLTLLNGLAMNLPFAPAEKQALLEARDAEQRYDLLLELFGMGFSQVSDLTH